MSPTRLQWLAATALLGLLPVGAYLVDRGAPLVALSLVSVVVIAWSVARMLEPSEAADAAAE